MLSLGSQHQRLGFSFKGIKVDNTSL
jgi:hypothetical protein